MPVNQRIKILIDRLNLNPNSFGVATSIPVPTVRRIVNDKSIPGTDFIEKILEVFPQVSAEWLLRGEGECFKNEALNSKEEDDMSEKGLIPHQIFTNGVEKYHEVQQIPLYDITASAGLNSLYNSSNNILDFIQIPNLPRCDGGIYVKGDSMYPLLKHGDMVVFQRLVDIPDEVDYGEMYVVDMSTAHLERIVVKYVKKSELGDEYIQLVSYNEKHHPPKDVHLSKVRAMAAVKASIRLS